jgi:hypothetical protein
MTLESATINVLIGSGITLLTVLITNVFQICRDRFQWQKQQELERQRWERDELWKIYMNCISNITDYLRSRHYVAPKHYVAPNPKRPYPPSLGGGFAYNSKLCGQAEAWLNLLLIYHPAKGTQEYINFANEVKALNKTADNLRLLLDKVVALAGTDPRLLAPISTSTEVK